MTYFLHDAPLASGMRIALDGEEAHHLLKVRRIRLGQRFALQDPDGRRFEAELTAAHRREAEALVHGQLPVPPAPQVAVTLLQAALKDKAAELLIEKCTELGVAALCFFPAARSTVANKALTCPGARARWERIAWEACKQCDRQFPPAIAVAASLEDALAAHPAEAARGAAGWVLDPAAARSAAAALRDGPAAADGSGATRALHVLIGPEGGFTADETATAAAAGYTPVRLGGTILRAETAALAACALALLGTA